MNNAARGLFWKIAPWTPKKLLVNLVREQRVRRIPRRTTKCAGRCPSIFLCWCRQLIEKRGITSKKFIDNFKYLSYNLQMESFGKRLKLLRNELKLSQEEIARKLGISTHSYLNNENDLSQPKISLLKKLKEMFNVNANWLVDDSGNMFDSFHLDEGIIKDPRFQDFFYWLNKYSFVQVSTLYNFEECKLKHPDKFLTKDQEPDKRQKILE